ncbi:hypothetical protein SERLA73DRAFT_156123 [Serpula lacrymans var. lacrymans S7.3]|uniref:Uncharacterized protein n=2 Tax=Serpula lacrymans var. lacrymans TaxID=341189 RepID=F8QD18_SERL3|nr:uncharacterized protein SERLADRAFT_411839 [Serpula lacrymans var. lacrymans S7.9]EGN94033.1 hypothetical protein SERLA73DRAFT_156123 [Serpula lacrymans var. lacrymans S7.3]EGO19385.1 hypothetical protein SERLADRAFT_411839 [Serpula lacrymans var. lacrymans S7.9]
MSVAAVDTLWAPGFIGYMVSLSLYGVTLGQTYYYFRTFPRDMLSLKFLRGRHIARVLDLHVLLDITRQSEDRCVVNRFASLASTLMTMFNAFRLWRFSGRNTILTGAIYELWLNTLNVPDSDLLQRQE